jgi:hypothetical protein
MKQTSKKRALKYIREKNAYNRGAEARNFFKVSGEVLRDEVFLNDLMHKEADKSIEWLKSKFKINFKIIQVEAGLDGDDFVRDLVTVMLKFKKA